jgi:hypothetical protein
MYWVNAHRFNSRRGRVLIVKLLCVAFALLALSAPQAFARISYGGGNGLSQKTAIRIVGAKGEMDGVHSEYVWLRKNRPGCRLVSQSVVQGKRIYDLMDINCGGKRQTVYFDITGFFGKY